MKLLSAYVKNFGSYKELSFDFDSQGLALVYGPTGSGKSTLLDIAPWALFGQTAKGGKADDVRAWDADEATTAVLTIETPEGILAITRTRGKSNENDLYFTEAGSEDTQIRGKDLTDTQKLLNKRLRMDFDGFAAASYSCDASPAQTFFIAPAKARRQLFEKITDLSLPAKLLEGAQNAKKLSKKDMQALNDEHGRASGRLDSIREYMSRAEKDSSRWEEVQADKIIKLLAFRDNFDKEKAGKIESLRTKYDIFERNKKEKLEKLSEKLEAARRDVISSHELDAHIAAIESCRKLLMSPKKLCEHCGAAKDSEDRERLTNSINYKEKILRDNELNLEKIKALQERHDDAAKERNQFEELLHDAKNLENHYEDQLAAEQDKENPYSAQFYKLKADYDLTSKKVSDIKSKVYEVDKRLNALDHIQDLSADLRAKLLQSSVSTIEHRTNAILETYFEGAFRVGFTVSSDDLDISIQKSGHECSYSQLSKGQRRLLTLAFSVALMEASANNLGLHFDCLMLDEPTDSMDVELKQAAYQLFEELASKHGTVLVIEHSRELQTMFSKKFAASLVGDHSELVEE